MTTAMFPGTFDPVTNGHLDLIQRSARMFDHVIVAIYDNPGKNQMFDTAERQHLLGQVTQHLNNVEITTFRKTLLVFLAKEHQANVLVRGVRSIADFEYEAQMTSMNRYLDESIDTIYLTPRDEYSYVSSSLVKEVALLGGDVSKHLPPPVLDALKQKL